MPMTSQDVPRKVSPAILCEGHARFTDTATTHAFNVQGETITLRHDPDVFPPSAFGLKFADHIDFRDCGRAADIGTGTGLLAILAAKKGATAVKATDISPVAVRLANLNVRMADAIDIVETRQGHFFGNHGGTFDVITANLPQEIIPPAYGSSISALQSQAINGGGTGGNAILLDFLGVAPNYMHPHTRLYIIVNTITDYKQTLQKMSDVYRATLVWQGVTGVKAFVSENIGFFGDLIDRRVVDLVEDEAGHWHARQFIYQLTLPS